MFLPPPGQSHDDHTFTPRMAANAPTGLDPTDLREPDVQEHDVRAKSCGGLDRLEPIVSQKRPVTAQPKKCSN